ncbi:MAG: bifunctional diaminohydroxyphosphoribosylaminopyrimidine deaminase/5-amino-6-(5-phosphoribosylamino)uracil reductase RibD [Verrucomicrobiota bacterium]
MATSRARGPRPAALSSPDADRRYLRRALALARRALGETSPNPMVGAVLVRRGQVIGEGWHHRAGQPHAEVEALRDAARRGHSPAGATLYVTLEPCCTHGRTPPCTEAIQAAGITRVVVAATDPNPRHAGRGLDLLRQAGIRVEAGLLADESSRLNEIFHHWIVTHTPFVTVKAAMTLDGRIATAGGDSKWITGERARTAAHGMRAAHDAVLVGVETVLHDDPALTVRRPGHPEMARRRLVLDTRARTPVSARLATDAFAGRTVLFVGGRAPARRVAALRKRVRVVEVAEREGRVDPAAVLAWLAGEGITSVLVEGGGEVNAAFLEAGLAQRVAFFIAPKVLGGADARRAVAGTGFGGPDAGPRFTQVEHRRLGPDLFWTARVAAPPPGQGA